MKNNPQKNKRTKLPREKKGPGLALFFLSLIAHLLVVQVNAQQAVYWRNEAANGNWVNGSNSCGEIGSSNSQWWYPGFSPNAARNNPSCYDGSTTRHNLEINNNAFTAMTLNAGGNLPIRQLVFGSGATWARTIGGISGDILSFSSNITNQSATTHSFTVGVSAFANDVNLTAQNGDLGFSGDYHTEGHRTYIITPLGRTIGFSGGITNNAGSFVKQGEGTQAFEGAGGFEADIYIDNGKVKLNRGIGAIGDLHLGAGTSAQTANSALLEMGPGNGITLGRSILVRNFDGLGGNRTLSFSNTAGTNTLTGDITLEKLLEIAVEGGGRGLVSGAISGAGQGVTKTGNGTLELTGANSYDGLTTVSGGTLQLNRPGGGTLPSTNNVVITGGVLQISTSQTLASITLTGGVLQIDPGVTLTITGTVSGTGGLFRGSPSSNLILNGATGTVTFEGGAANNFLKDLSLTGNADITLGDTLKIAGGSSFGTVDLSGSGVLHSNGFLILKSNATGTARVAAISSSAPTPISGEVTVERQIPTAASLTRRAWRLLAIPVKSPTREIWQAWGNGAKDRVNLITQGGVPDPAQNAEFGTIITGHAYSNANDANNAGYDWWPALYISPTAVAATSLKKFERALNDLNGTWPSTRATRTMAKTKLDAAEPAYMLFVRGNRDVATGTGPCTLAPVGLLNTGDVTTTVPTMSTGKYFTYGNPYPSTLDLGAVIDDPANLGLVKDAIRVWDANLGSYGAYETITRPTPSDPWESNLHGALPGIDNIHSGQGVLLETNVSSPASLVTRETHKTPGNPGLSPLAAIPLHNQRLYVRIQVPQTDGSLILADGAVAGFKDGYLLSASDAFDKEKLEPVSGNFALAFTSEGKALSFEGRPPVLDNDTLYIRSQGLTAMAYTLEFEAKNMERPGLKAYLVDNHTGKEIEIMLDGNKTNIPFACSTDATSVAPNRFMVVFKVARPNVIDLSGQSLRPNHLLEWKVGYQDHIARYEVEQSSGNNQYRKIATILCNGEAWGNYQWVQSNPGGGVRFYRIRGIQENGNSIYSNVVLLGMHNSGASLAVGPNPVTTQGAVNLGLAGLAAGSYTIMLLDANGNTVSKKVIKHNGANQAYNFVLPTPLAPGNYFFRVVGKGENLVHALIKQ